MTEEKPKCPHCGQVMSRWQPPDGTSWGQAIQCVCFNDDCPYYVEGWNWMNSQFKRNVSYRHRYDPSTGETGPLPVWSADATRNCIVEDS